MPRTLFCVSLFVFFLSGFAGLSDALEARLRIDTVDFLRWAPEKIQLDYHSFALEDVRKAELLELGLGITDLIYSSKVSLKKDGIFLEENIRVAEYLDETSLQTYGNHEIIVDAYSEVVTIQQAQVLLPDGTTVELDPKTVQIVTDTREDIFSDSYRVVIPWPGLKQGAITFLRYSTALHTKKRVVPWTRMYYPQTLTPREQFRVEVHWDSDRLEPDWSLDSDVLHCHNAKNESIVCVGNGINPYKGDPDINYYDVLPTLIFSSPTSWKELSLRFRKFTTAALSSDENVKRQLQKIVGVNDTDEERLSRIHSFVSRKIRYVGFEHGTNGVVPHHSSITLSQRYGDCKDKTVLFLDLAQLSGINAYPVITSSYRQNIEKLAIPSSAYFDHMVACGSLQSGKQFCVDLTDSNTSYDVLPASIQGAVGLRLRGENPEPERMPLEQHRWISKVESRYAFDHEGRLSETQRRIHQGVYAAVMRGSLSGMSSDEIRKWAISNYHENISDLVEPAFTIEGLDTQQTPFIIESKTTYEDFSESAEPLNYYQYDSWLRYLVNGFFTKNERHPYSFVGFSYEGTNYYELNNQQEFKNLGPTLNFRSSFGSMERKYEIHETTLVVTTTVDVPQRMISLSEIPQFNQFLKLIKQQSAIRFETGAKPK